MKKSVIPRFLTYALSIMATFLIYMIVATQTAQEKTMQANKIHTLPAQIPSIFMVHAAIDFSLSG